MSSGATTLTPKVRRPGRAAASDRGAWSPRWFWPSFAAPGIIYLLVFFVFPFYVVLAITFGGVGAIQQEPVPFWNPLTWQTNVLNFTFSNITHGDGLYQAAFVHTFEFVGLATLGCLLIGYPFAYFLARRAGRFRGIFLVLFFAPFWVSYMLRMLAWISLLQDNGWVNKLMVNTGILGKPFSWLNGHPVTVVIGLIYGYVPYMILPLFSTLDRIHPSMLEAGRDLGAGPARTFLRVTLPQSRQAILAGFVICGLPMFGDYFTETLMAGGSSNTRMLGNAVVDSLGFPLFIARGAALILVMLVMLLVPILYYLRSTNRAATEGLV